MCSWVNRKHLKCPIREYSQETHMRQIYKQANYTHLSQISTVDLTVKLGKLDTPKCTIREYTKETHINKLTNMQILHLVQISMHSRS